METGEWDRDLHDGRAALLLHSPGRLSDGPHLHPVDLRSHDPKPAASQAQHRVRLLKPFDHSQLPPELRCFLRGAVLAFKSGDLLGQLSRVGEELVQWWVEQTDGDRQAVHSFEDLLEVTPLERLELGERLF